MKNLLLILIPVIFIAFAGCSKDDDTPGNSPNPSSNTIKITNLTASGDTVRLTWTKLDNARFKRYHVLRRSFKATDTTSSSGAVILAYITDKSVTTYTDTDLPEEPYMEYQVMGVLENSSGPYTEIMSNVWVFERPELKTFRLNPMDVLHDAEDHRLYVIGNDSGKISILDYSSREIIREISSFATLGYSALGTFNGNKELYVPRTDGWLYIYNANTLEKTGQINAGNACYSAAYNNGKIFVVVDTAYYDYVMRVFDRATGDLISQTDLGADIERLELVPGSNTKLYGIGSNRICSLEYDATGALINSVFSYLSGNPTRLNAVEVFPDGQKIITNETGSIISNTLTLIQNLPYGDNDYSWFTVNTATSSIYAGCSNYKHVIRYSSTGFTESERYPCKGYPDAIFHDNGNLVVLSRYDNSWWGGEPIPCYLEIIPIQ